VGRGQDCHEQYLEEQTTTAENKKVNIVFGTNANLLTQNSLLLPPPPKTFYVSPDISIRA
jgi:hypothetical protein